MYRRCFFAFLFVCISWVDPPFRCPPFSPDFIFLSSFRFLFFALSSVSSSLLADFSFCPLFGPVLARLHPHLFLFACEYQFSLDAVFWLQSLSCVFASFLAPQFSLFPSDLALSASFLCFDISVALSFSVFLTSLSLSLSLTLSLFRVFSYFLLCSCAAIFAYLCCSSSLLC